MTLCLSTGSVWRVAGSRGRIGTVHIVEELFSGLVDGVELCFIDPEGFEKFELDEKSIKFLKGMKYNSLHAPIIEYGKNTQTEKILEKINKIGQEINLKHVTFHPNHVKDFSVLKKLKFKTCIENMRFGERHKGWQFPKEINEFLEKEKDFGFCFDVTHAMSNGIKPKEFLHGLEEKISCVHLNATEEAGLHSHNFVFSSSKQVQEKIEPVFALRVPLIIEVAVEKEKIQLIKKEISFVRKKLA